MTSPGCRPACLALLAIVAMARVSTADEPRVAPPFAGATIPDPPSQREPWTAPGTRLPRYLAAATAALFEQGLADPRGSEYRRVELTSSRPHGGGAVVSTHAWALPAAGDQRQRFAVAWDGLVYPALSVGEPADLAADVRALIESHAKPGPGGGRRGGWDGQMGRSSRFRGFNEPPEIPAIEPDSLRPIKVCLLLRLGRGDLAEAVWQAGTGIPRADGPAAKVDLTSYGVSYLSLATDWAWAGYERAIAAHVRGDDALALIDARGLAAARPAIEEKAEELGFSRPRGPDGRGRPTPYLPFLVQLPELLADQERRAAEPLRPPVPPPGADRPARIAALIRDLDRLTVIPFAGPGNMGLGGPGSVPTLVAEGEDAVEPLIAALRHDDRLTRTARSWDIEGDRTLIPASEAEYGALAGILKVDFLGPRTFSAEIEAGGKPARAALADRIEAHWAKFRGVALVERRYRTLADDRAEPGAWLAAAREIAGTEGPRPDRREQPPGESLRDGRSPSVSALMARRAETLLRRPMQGVDQAHSLASALEAWDPPASLPILREVSRAYLARSAEPHGQHSATAGRALAGLALDRLRLGDPGGAEDYAAWLRTTSPGEAGHNLFAVVEPLYRRPADPVLAGAAEWLFNDPRSAWVPLFAKGRNGSGYQQAELISSPLVAVPGFRRMLLRMLDDRAVAGSCHLDREGGLQYKMEAGWSGGRGTGGVDPQAPTFDVEVSFRVADYYASELASLEGAPPFQLYWPEASRDAGLAAIKAYLARFADRFAASPAGEHNFEDFPHPRAHLAFPPLDRPATREDADRTRAIFSLEGEGERRVVPLAARPLKARWLAYQAFPVNRTPVDPKVGPVTEYLREGKVWQAEEILRDGRWRRYYGFVGPHVVARIPAEEVDFYDYAFDGKRPADGVDFAFFGPYDPASKRAEAGNRPGAPLVVALRLRNRAGYDRAVPTSFVREEAGKVAAIRRGVEIRVDRAPPGTKPMNPSIQPKTPIAWAEVPSRVLGTFEPDGATRALRPSETLDAFAVDLGVLFDLKEKGLYRVRLAIAGDAGVGGGTSLENLFVVGEVETPAAPRFEDQSYD